MEHFQDPEAAAAALVRWAENRSAGKVAVLKKRLAARDSELERMASELRDLVKASRQTVKDVEWFKYCMSREAI